MRSLDRLVRWHEIRAKPDRSTGLRVGAEDRPADRLVTRAAQANEADNLALTDTERQRPLIAGDKVLDLQQRSAVACAGGRLVMHFKVSAKHVPYD